MVLGWCLNNMYVVLLKDVRWWCDLEILTVIMIFFFPECPPIPLIKVCHVMLMCLLLAFLDCGIFCQLMLFHRMREKVHKPSSSFPH